jgi:DNA mismatch endonuclease Vsr
MTPLEDVLEHDGLRPLSYRATRGFLSRIEESGIKLDERFLEDLEGHLAAMRADVKQTTSWASSTKVRSRMQAVKQRNTTPELKLRRALSDRKLRYRLQLRAEPDLRWRSDIVFKGAKVVVDVRGCFWHSCPEHRTSPKANAERWQAKLAGNRERDARMEAGLHSRGWTVVVVWEHEDMDLAAAKIEAIVRNRTRSATSIGARQEAS